MYCGCYKIKQIVKIKIVEIEIEIEREYSYARFHRKDPRESSRKK